MALTVEDGTGLTNADSFVTLAAADAYHAAIGNATWTGTDEVKEQAIRRASRFLTDSFKWKGYPIKGRDQSLAWPRFYVEDSEGYGIQPDEVPSEVIRATHELALLELITPGTMTPTVTLSARVKREKVGPLEVEYLNAGVDAWADRPVVTKVIDMVGGLLRPGGSRLQGQSFRG